VTYLFFVCTLGFFFFFFCCWGKKTKQHKKAEKKFLIDTIVGVGRRRSTSILGSALGFSDLVVRRSTHWHAVVLGRWSIGATAEASFQLVHGATNDT